jgi:hypothetical protein
MRPPHVLTGKLRQHQSGYVCVYHLAGRHNRTGDTFYHGMMVEMGFATVVIASRTVKLIKIGDLAVFAIHLVINRLQTIQKAALLINRQVQIVQLPVRHSLYKR